MSDQMFGPPESVEWSEPDPNSSPSEEGGIPSGAMDVGDGNTLALDAAALQQALAHLPGMEAALQHHGDRVANLANQNATIPGARYETVVTRDGNGVPRAIVRPANDEARIDEATHSTLAVAYTTICVQGTGE